MAVSDIPLDPQSVSTEEFIRYLIEKNVSSKCPSCGNEHAFVSTNDEDKTAVQTRADVVRFDAWTDGRSAFSRETILSFSTVCDNCGYIRSYAAQSVYLWLKNSKDAAEASE